MDPNLLDRIDSLLDAYGSANYFISAPGGDLLAKVGERSAALDELLADHDVTQATLITAWNPRSEPTDPETNKRQTQLLRSELEQHSKPLLPARGQAPDGSWPAEEGFLALGLPYREAERLGRDYGQNAVLWLEKGESPRLLLLLDPQGD